MIAALSSSFRNVVAAGLVLACVALLPQPAMADESVCLQCHGSQPGHLGEPVGLWRDSVHAANGIACEHCHGGDPTDFAMAMSPERGFVGVPEATEIPDFCGQCHIGVREDYLGSAHGQALGRGGPQCVTCHGAHAVKPASLDLINAEDCSRCHAYERAETIRTAMVATEERLAEVATRIDVLYRLGLRTQDKQERLFAVRNDFRRLFHSVDVERVRGATADFQTRIGELAAELDDVQASLDRRKPWGGGAFLLLVLAGIVALLIRKTYQDDENRPSTD